MASYAKIADKLSKKLGEYEDILEGKAGSSTEPTDVKTAKLKIPQIKKALNDLEESQKIEVQIKELIDQGVPKEEAKQAVMQQVQQEQMQMQQQQQQMPQQGMQQGGYLPSYQVNSRSIGEFLPNYQEAPRNIERKDNIKDYYKYRKDVDPKTINMKTTEGLEASLWSYMQNFRNADTSDAKYEMIVENLDALSDQPDAVAENQALQEAVKIIQSDPARYMDKIQTMVPSEGITVKNLPDSRKNIQGVARELNIGNEDLDAILRASGMEGGFLKWRDIKRGVIKKGLGLDKEEKEKKKKKQKGGYLPSHQVNSKSIREFLPSYEEEDNEIPWGKIANIGLGAAATAPIWRNIDMSRKDIDYYKGFVNPYTGAVQEGLEDMRRLTEEAEEAIKTPRYYNPRAQLVAARAKRDTAMQNAKDASGGSARFALQNRALTGEMTDKNRILTQAQNINNQWNDPAQKAQGFMGLAGAYGNMGRMQYGLGQDLGAERWKEFDYARKAEAVKRGFGTQASMDVSEWAQTQQQMLNQRRMDELSAEQLKYLTDNFDWVDNAWVSKTA